MGTKKKTSILKFLTFAKIDGLKKTGTSDEKLWKELHICRVKLHNLPNILIVQYKLCLKRILSKN